MSHHALSSSSQAIPPPTTFYIAQGHDFIPTVATVGPWNANLQHGGPPSALLARCIERKARAVGLPTMARLTVLLLRPIPVAAVLSLTVEAIREGKKAGHFAATMLANGKEVARGTALCLRREAVGNVPPPPPTLHTDVPTKGKPFHFPFLTGEVGYHTSHESFISDGTHGKGPTTVWFRAAIPLLPSEELSPMQRVALVADSANGLGFYIDFHKHVFMNPDLTINLFREPVGEWICLQSRTDLADQEGCGLAAALLFDEKGRIGQATQSLLLEARL